MKITPLEIRQKTFEKAFRGLDKDEVHAYLQSLSQEWEKLLDENKEFRIKLENSEKEVEKLREVETSLFKTLKTAEDTGANLIDQAEKTAQLHMRETQLNAEGILNDAKKIAKDTIESADMESRAIVEDMEESVKNLMQVVRTLENYRDDVISEIKNVAQEALEKTNRAEVQRQQLNLEEILFKAKELSSNYRLKKIKKITEPTPERVVNRVAPEPVKKEVKTEPKQKKGNSFFDDIE